MLCENGIGFLFMFSSPMGTSSVVREASHFLMKEEKQPSLLKFGNMLLPVIVLSVGR